MKTETQTIQEQLTELGFALRVDAGPVGALDEGKDKERPWPHIAFEVELLFKGRPILVEPTCKSYRLGIGHVAIKKAQPDSTACTWTANERSMLYAWRKQPYANFIDKTLQAQVAAKLAKQQKVVPQIADVLHSLLSDGDAYFSAQSFEQWASELEYDSDSRKAEAIYKQCDTIGRKLAAVVPAYVLNQAREILKDY